jgi:hypothetical protein
VERKIDWKRGMEHDTGEMDRMKEMTDGDVIHATVAMCVEEVKENDHHFRRLQQQPGGERTDPEGKEHLYMW